MGEPTPQSASAMQLPLHAPLTQLPAAPPGHCESSAHAPCWKTPSGPTGEAQVLVTYAKPLSMVIDPTWFGKQPVVWPLASLKPVSRTGGRSMVVAVVPPTWTL